MSMRENLGYLVRDGRDRDVACLLFGAPAWKCRVRDKFLGWNSPPGHEQLTRIANNTRFLILPWVEVSFLASHVSGLVSRRIGRDWMRQVWGHGLDWLESFVDAACFPGQLLRRGQLDLGGRHAGARTAGPSSTRVWPDAKRCSCIRWAHEATGCTGPGVVELIEHHQRQVLEALRRGEFDQIEIIGHADEKQFFELCFQEKILEALAQSMPTARRGGGAALV